MLKRVFAVHDISGIGKCSLTAAIPVISAAGIECNPVPTAVLSSHTGNLSGYTFRDLTSDLKAYCSQWKELGIKPDGIYTGYLGSALQVEIVKEIISMFSQDKPLIVVDPAMADEGELYKGFDSAFPDEMKSLCEAADVIVPNLTEASLLTGIPYSKKYDREYIAGIAEALSPFTGRYIVLTGLSYSDDKIGCLVYDKTSGESHELFSTRFPGIYYGTGDIFASVLTSALIKGLDIVSSAQAALEFTSICIETTYKEQTDPRFGVALENHLPYICTKLGGI